jgi:hypothetical protein
LPDSLVDRIASDPGLRQILTVARSWGVSPRRFLQGWEPTRTVVFERNDAREIVTARITSESEWDEDSRQLVLAFAEYEARLCPNCGGDQNETTDKENDGRYQVTKTLCYRCVDLAIMQQASTHSHKESLLWGAHLPNLEID